MTGSITDSSPADRTRERAPGISIGPATFAPVTEAQVIEYVIPRALRGQGGWIITPNADILRQASNHPDIAALLQQADLLVADGMPIVWASRILKTPLPARVCGSDLVWSVAAASEANQLSVFLLGGGRPGTAENAGAELLKKFPRLQIAGTHFPPFGFETSEECLSVIETTIAIASPNIVYVALGFPKAELLIARLRRRFPAIWWIGVGISLSFVAGEVRRAPSFMQNIGLEWLFRLWEEPGRLAKRYLWHDIPFVIRLLSNSVVVRLRRPHRYFRSK